jgi:hypothetical protein
MITTCRPEALALAAAAAIPVFILFVAAAAGKEFVVLVN